MNATLSDLYGGSIASITSRSDIGPIQPFATSSILQHHYQSQASAVASLTGELISSATAARSQTSAAAGAFDNSGERNNGNNDNDASVSSSNNANASNSHQVSLAHMKAIFQSSSTPTLAQNLSFSLGRCAFACFCTIIMIMMIAAKAPHTFIAIEPKSRPQPPHSLTRLPA